MKSEDFYIFLQRYFQKELEKVEEVYDRTCDKTFKELEIDRVPDWPDSFILDRDSIEYFLYYPVKQDRIGRDLNNISE